VDQTTYRSYFSRTSPLKVKSYSSSCITLFGRPVLYHRYGKMLVLPLCDRAAQEAGGRVDARVCVCVCVTVYNFRGGSHLTKLSN
jgi:hypothetical protein